MVRSSARPTSQATQTKYARLRGLVKRKCAVFSVNSWIAPMAPNPRAKAMRIKAKVAEKAEVPKSSTKWVPTHTTAATGITIAAIIKKTMKKYRVSRQHFQKYITAPFGRAAKRSPGGLVGRHS